MEDEKIRDLFKGFDPELSSDSLFMSTLERSMESMEVVKQYQRSQRLRSRWSICIAAVCGIAVGAAFSLLLPLIGSWISTIEIEVPVLSVNIQSIYFSLLAWILLASVSVFTSINAYDLAMTKLPWKSNMDK